MIDSILLPKDWKILPLKEVCRKITDGSHNPPAPQLTGVPMISAKDVINGRIDFSNPRLINETDFERENKRTQVTPGDILLTIVATIGRCAVVPINAPKFTLQRSVAVIKTNAYPNFLVYFFQSIYFQKQLLDNAKGTAQKGVYLKTLSELLTFIPPEHTQQLIVSKLEELFSKLDKGVESLKTLQQQLKVYRQSVLKWAFEGRLTNDNVKDGELPEGWRQVIFQDLILKIRSGTAAVPTNEITYFPILRSSSVRTGAINFGDVKYIAASTLIKGDDLLSAGDLLFTRLNGSVDYVGNCAKVPNTFPKNLIYPDRLFRVKLKEENLADYIVYFFASPLCRRTIEKKAKSTAGHMRISTPDITTMLVPICSQHEQKKIVQEIESRLSVCDKIEETITNGLKEAEALRQSILKQAFEGKLIK